MALPIIRMTARDRKLIVNLMAHKRKEFEGELQKRVRAYLRKLNERKLLNAELEEYHKAVIVEKEETLKKAEFTTENAQKIAATAPGSIGAGASTIATVGGTIASEYIKHDIEKTNSEELKEKLESSKLGLYIKEEQHDIIATRVAEIIGFRLQFLIFRLNGSTDGYMRLAQFLADAMEAFAIEKLRGNNNKIDALIDAAFPTPSSLRYKDWRLTWENGYHRTLEIDQRCNNMIERCGPAVRFLLGKHKTNTSYSIVDAINHSLILNGRGEVISGSQSNKTTISQLEGDNDTPMLLLARNEEPYHLGLGHGTYLTEQILEDEHVIALLRLVPGFFKDDLSHDMTLKAPSLNKDAAADLVFAAERHECSWTKERDERWQERTNHIASELSKDLSFYQKYFKEKEFLNKQEQHELKDYIDNRQDIAHEFDAKKAEADVNHEVLIAYSIQKDLSIGEQDFAIRRKKQYRAAKCAEHITLAVQQLIRASKHLNQSHREGCLRLARNALHTARATIAATRDAPVCEHLASDKMDAMAKTQKELYENSAKHLEFSWHLLQGVTNHAENLQAPTLVKNFVYRQKTNRYDTACDLIYQAEHDLNWSEGIIKQVEILLKNSKQKLAETLEENTETRSQELLDADLLVPFIPGESRFGSNCAGLGCTTMASTDVYDPSEEMARETVASEAHVDELLEPFTQQDSESNSASLNTEGRSLPIDFENALTECVTEFQKKKTSSLKVRVKRINCYINEIQKVFTDIFASLGIDALTKDGAFYFAQPVTLTPTQRALASKANDDIRVAKAHRQNAQNHLKNYTKLKKHLWHQHMKVRIIHDETVILQKRDSLYQTLKEIENDYKEKNPLKNDRFIAAKVSAMNRRIQHLARELPETDYKTSSVFTNREDNLHETLFQLDKEAKRFEHQINEQALAKAKDIQKNAQNKIEALGNEPLSLSQAAEYARIARDAREEIIRVASGDVVASMSMAAEITRVVQEHQRTNSEQQEVETSLLNLQKTCQTDTKTLTRNDLTILRLNEAKKQIRQIILALSKEEFSDLENTKANKESANSIRLSSLSLINELVSSAAHYSGKSKGSLISLLQEHLSQQLSKLTGSLFLNWGLWTLSTCAYFIITTLKTSLTQAELYEMSEKFKLAQSAESKVLPKAIMLSTKLILSSFQELEDAVYPDDDLSLDPKNNSLNSLLIRDKLKWAGELSQKEKASLFENAGDPSSYQLGATGTAQSRQHRQKMKSSPIRLIHRQLKRFCTLYLDDKKHVTNMLNEYMDILQSFRKSIEKNKILSNLSSNDPYQDIFPLIDKISELIKGELKIVRDKVKFIADLKDKLLSKNEKQRVFFNYWKARVHNAIKGSELLRALQEATEERSLKAFERIKEGTANTDMNEEFELFLNSGVISHSLEDIEEMLHSLEKRINAVRIGKARPLRSSSFFADKTTSLDTKSDDSDNEPSLNTAGGSDQENTAEFVI